MRRLITFFVDNYVLSISVFGALLLFGVVSALDRGVNLFPEISVPVVAVSSSYAGAGPEEISRQVVEPLEGALATLSGITSVSSLSTEGFGIVIAQFSADLRVDQVAVDVSQRVNQVAGALPEGASTPVVQKFDPNDLPIMNVALSAPGEALVAVQAYAEDELTPQLRRAEGVADVTVIGPAAREVQVLLDPGKLERYGLSPQQVAGAIGAGSADVAAGSLTVGERRLLLAGRAAPATLEQLSEIRVDPQRGLRVADVATVRETSADVTSYARLNGEPVILLEVRKASGSNSVATAAAVRQALGRVELPEGYQATIVGDSTVFVAASVADTLRELLISALAVSLVVLLFVGRLGSVFAVVLAIPVSLAGAVVVFAFFGFTFNVITLLALTVAIGLVVDDAIVVAENIDRYRELGYGRREAVLRGASEVSTAVLAATLSLLAVFIPISLLPGIVGQFFAEFGITMAAAIVFSYFEAMLFLTVRLALSPDPFPPGWRELPGAAAKGKADLGWALGLYRRAWFWLLLAGAGAGLYALRGAAELRYWPLLVLLPLALLTLRYLGRLALGVLGALALNLYRAGTWLVARARGGYVASLERLLRRPWLVLAVAAGLFASLFWVYPQIGFNFQPPSDSGQLNVTVELPSGTSLARTDAVATQLEGALMAEPAVRTVQLSVGSGGLLGNSPSNEAELTVELVGREARAKSTDELALELERRLGALLEPYPEAQLRVSTGDQATAAPGTSGRYSTVLASTDLALVRERARQAVGVLEGLPELRNVTSDLSDAASERVLVLDPAQLDGTGLTVNDVYQTLRAYTVGLEPARLRRGGEELPIRVRVNPLELGSETRLLSLPVYAPALRSSLPFGQLGRFEPRDAPATINREGQAYSVTLRADLVPGATLSRVQEAAQAALRKAGVVDARVSEVRDSSLDLLADLLFYGPIAFALALLLNYLAIGSQFNSFKYPLYLLLTVPLALVGAVWLFYLTGTSLDVISVLGVVMLVGLVTKNAILLLDVALQRLAEGTGDLRAALLEAARVRFRPILMTTLTVVVISLPLLLGLGEGSELRYPLGLVILGGVMSSALLTFYVVPAAFYLFERQRTLGGPRPALAAQPDTAEPQLVAPQR